MRRGVLYICISAWASCIAYPCRWAMREPWNWDEQKYRLPRLFLYCRLWGCLSAQQNEKHEKAGIVGLVANRDFRLLYHIHHHTRKSKRETSSLCKKLQESKGNVTLGELSDYVRQNVLKRSTVMLNTTQTPTTSSSPKLLTQWREITIK